ncbi:MAG: hypothetical protein JW841_10355 [Deltaproteobacteria bacterium]|nr:hypothetical protein [Deltaproteobacteria bacterium]
MLATTLIYFGEIYKITKPVRIETGENVIDEFDLELSCPIVLSRPRNSII